MLTWIAIAAAQECLPAQDCDQDGYTFAQGDCDEADPDVNPGVSEDCTNEIDDDCDGLFNQGCDAGARQGTLWGGGLCQQSTDSSAAWLVLLPLWSLRRRGRPQRP